MKKIFLSTIGLIIFSIGLLNAQTNQGKFLLGLSSDIFDLGYTTTKSISDANGSEDLEESFRVNFHPNMSYFIIDNLAIGLDLSIGFSTLNPRSEDYKFATTSLSAGPFVRYYIPTSKVLPFFELSGSVGTWKTKLNSSDNQDDNEYKHGIMSFKGGVGLAVPLGESVMVDVLAGYNTDTRKQKEDNEDNKRTVIGTLGLEVGFVILLGSN